MKSYSDEILTPSTVDVTKNIEQLNSLQTSIILNLFETQRKLIASVLAITALNASLLAWIAVSPFLK